MNDKNTSKKIKSKLSQLGVHNSKETKFAKKNRETILPTRQALLINDLISVLLFGISISLFASLITYSPYDPGWIISSNYVSVNNFMGIVGAYVADVLFSIFGLSAWFFVSGIFYLGFHKITTRMSNDNNVISILKIFTFILLINSSSAFIHTILKYNNSFFHYSYSGILGEYIAKHLSMYLSNVGFSCISLFFVVVTFFFTFGISYWNVSEFFGFILEKSFINIKDIIISFTSKNEDSDNSLSEAKKSDVNIQLLFNSKLQQNKVEETKPKEIKPLFKEIKKNIINRESSLGLPSTSLLDNKSEKVEKISQQTIEFVSNSIENKLSEFQVDAKIINAEAGPVITRYELLPSKGVRGEKIVALDKEIARGLAINTIRIVETIPGKNTMGIEVPNFKRQTIFLREIFESEAYKNSLSKLTIALGKDIAGNVIVTDLAKMPHLLVAGTTGSGKSVAVNVMILSILFNSKPNEVKFIMIDPKMVELSFYQDIPHLLAPVITDMNQATNALKWVVGQMEKRYRVMAGYGCKNIDSFNQKILETKKSGAILNSQSGDEGKEELEPWPYIVVIIDELADLMMVVGKKIEQYIARIAQKARAVGIHLLIATQRPSVDVITGLIKANIPARISFQVSSKVDSRTILDQMGAETLIGQGDMLFLYPGTGIPKRVHGAYVNDSELNKVVDFLKSQGSAKYQDDILNGETEGMPLIGIDDESNDNIEKDAIFDEAVKFIYDTKRCSISALQTRFGIGYNRAARIMNHLEQINMVIRNERGGFELVKNSQ